jgi:hypothetical protein
VLVTSLVGRVVRSKKFFHRKKGESEFFDCEVFMVAF